MSQDLAPILPAKVTVVYRNRRCSGTVDGVPRSAFYTHDVGLSTITLTDSDATAPTSSPGKVKVFHDTAVGQCAPGGDPTNAANLDALAKQVAQDFYDWASVAFDVVYFGVVAPDPNGLVDLVEWCATAEEGWTRVRSAPFNDQPEELQHQDGGISSCQDTSASAAPVQKLPAVECYGPPTSCTGGGAQATATIAGGAVNAINVTNGGSSYTSAPTVQFEQGPETGGSGAAATAQINAATGKVTGVTITNGGSGYTRAPLVSFSGGGTKLQITRYRIALEDGRLWQWFVSTDCLS